MEGSCDRGWLFPQ